MACPLPKRVTLVFFSTLLLSVLLTAPLVDHILFVVQAEKSSMANVRKALGMLPKEKVLGIVLNRQADADATKYYY